MGAYPNLANQKVLAPQPESTLLGQQAKCDSGLEPWGESSQRAKPQGACREKH